LTLQRYHSLGLTTEGTCGIDSRNAGGEQGVELYCGVGDAITIEDWVVANKSQAAG